jgi:Protein of unknown function (DUF3617)
MSNNDSRPLALLWMGMACGLFFPTPASAAELPARKPGLWEVKTAIEGNPRGLTVQQCIDEATDQMLQSSAGPFSAPACPDREVKKSDASMTIDSRCTLGGKPASAHAVVSGSFDSAYTMTVTAAGGELPAVKMTIEGKWLGACAADQKPGDVMMPGGVKVNVPELQKRAPAPDLSPQPSK